jgi:hypothetical protein
VPRRWRHLRGHRLLRRRSAGKPVPRRRWRPGPVPPYPRPRGPTSRLIRPATTSGTAAVDRGGGAVCGRLPAQRGRSGTWAAAGDIRRWHAMAAGWWWRDRVQRGCLVTVTGAR